MRGADGQAIDTITGLHITSVKDNGDACVFTDPSAPVNSVLQNFAGVVSKAFTGSGANIDTGAGVIVRLQTLPADPIHRSRTTSARFPRASATRRS